MQAVKWVVTKNLPWTFIAHGFLDPSAFPESCLAILDGLAPSRYPGKKGVFRKLHARDKVLPTSAFPLFASDVSGWRVVLTIADPWKFSYAMIRDLVDRSSARDETSTKTYA